jgi:hypothetical protein
MRSKFINLLLYMLASYIVFFTIFFFSFSVVSTDTVIALGLIILFYLIYFFSNKQITSYLLLQSKNIFVFFVNIMYLLSIIKLFALSLNKSYLDFIWYKLNGLILSSSKLDFTSLKYDFIKMFFFNKINSFFFYKLLIIGKCNKYINNLEVINNNNLTYNNNLTNSIFLFLILKENNG